jgi:hypothetical protein
VADGRSVLSIAGNLWPEYYFSITEGAARLIERRWPAEEAMADHVARILALRGGHGDRIWSVDAVHRKYLSRQN